MLLLRHARRELLATSPVLAPLDDSQMFGEDGEEAAGKWGEGLSLKGDKVMKFPVARGFNIYPSSVHMRGVLLRLFSVWKLSIKFELLRSTLAAVATW